MPRSYPPRGDILVRHYVRMRTFSTMERVLVHLSSEALPPEAETQEGIALATHSGRSTLTKWLDRLEGKGLVSRRRIRVAGHPLPKYGYALTEAGWEKASALRIQLGSRVVAVRVPDIGQLSARMSDLERISSAQLDLTRAVASVHRGQIDLTRPAPGFRKGTPLLRGSGLHRVDRFFGRVEERRRLDKWWESSARCLFVTGLAGVGKSALVTAWVQGRRLGVPVLGIEVRPSTTPAALLNELGAFLTVLGKPALAAHLAQGTALDVAFVQRLLRRDLQAQPALLVLDNADQASRATSRLVERLFVETGLSVPVKIILLGRRLPRWMGKARETGIAVEVCTIRGLDAQACRDLLRSRGVWSNTSLINVIVRKSQGHPLLLHLAASTGQSDSSTVLRHLENEVWDSLDAKDRSILGALSIFRKSVSERILARVAEADQRALGSLAERNLMERTMSGGYMVHDLVRDIVSGRLPAGGRRRLHVRAAELLLQGADFQERWEGVYHLLRAGRLTQAAAILDSAEAPLLDSVAAEEIATLVRGLTFDEEETGTYLIFAEVFGDSLRIRGHMGPAFFQYDHARTLAEKAGHAERIPRLLRKMAFVERCRNRYPRALGFLVEARGRLLDQKNPAEMVEVLREMALAEQASGALEDAAHHLNEAIDLATEISDRAAVSRTLLALGSLETLRGRPEQGLDLGVEGLRVAERSGNVTEIAHAHVDIGTTLIELGRPEESLKHFEEGFAAARLLGNLRLMAYSTMNETSALLHLRRYEAARNRLRRSMDYFEILEETDGTGLLKTYEGEVEMGLGHWSRAQEAWRQGITLLRSRGSLAKLAHVLRDASGYFAQHGDAREGLSYLIEAQDIALRTGNRELASRIEADLALLREPPRRAHL